ncbi:MAG: glycosyltransferase family 4 protein [Bacteroidaceae bacterium]|nr:glycosyltransferase family 4 protein [Bacteroidaceae bacterium]
MKLVYLIAGTYRAGGMERVLAGKANWLVEHYANDVLIVTTDQRGRQPFFPFESRVRHTDLGINYEENNGASFLNKLLRYPFKQLRHRKRLTALLKTEKADVVVSMFCNDAQFLPRIKDGSRKVLEIHFSRYKRLQYGRQGVWALADRWRSRNDMRVVRRFDRFVVLTMEDRGYWEQTAALDNICVIPNARTFVLPADACSRAANHTVLAVGRYNVQKAFDRLINAWALLQRRVGAGTVGWKLRLVGDGELRGQLQELIDSLDLNGSVILGQAETDMPRVYGSAGIYAMTSLYEGLPMVLLEAQAAGLPIVSMTCKCGPRDVVTDGTDGFLVPEGDIEAMADRLLLLMTDDALRSRMGHAARLNSDRFDESAIMDRWTSLFNELTVKRGE